MELSSRKIKIFFYIFPKKDFLYFGKKNFLAPSLKNFSHYSYIPGGNFPSSKNNNKKNPHEKISYILEGNLESPKINKKQTNKRNTLNFEKIFPTFWDY